MTENHGAGSRDRSPADSPLAKALRHAAAWSAIVLIAGFAIAAVAFAMFADSLALTQHQGSAAFTALALAGVLSLATCEATPLIEAHAADRGVRGTDLLRHMVRWWCAKIVAVMMAVWAVLALMPASVLDTWVFGIALAAGIAVGDNVSVLALRSARIPILDEYDPGRPSHNARQNV
ncbi:MAG: hypothetical protein PUF51_05575 [Bifidobacteriaceae bacterium]|nr:hypothetical protein [Bifidobacteriaceae bacterium]